MLRDDAIREGLIDPAKEDIARMNLTSEELKKLEKLRKTKVPPVIPEAPKTKSTFHKK